MGKRASGMLAVTSGCGVLCLSGALDLVEKYSVGNAGRFPGLFYQMTARRTEAETRYISVSNARPFLDKEAFL
jgi:hypothetical protein